MPESALLTQFRKYIKAWNTHNFDNFALYWNDDIFLHLPGCPPLRGKGPIRALLEGELSFFVETLHPTFLIEGDKTLAMEAKSFVQIAQDIDSPFPFTGKTYKKGDPFVYELVVHYEFDHELRITTFRAYSVVLNPSPGFGVCQKVIEGFEPLPELNCSPAVPETQDAIIVEEIGKPVVLRERPVPKPQKGEILVEVTVAALNPYDKHVRDWGLYVAHRMPVVLCNDFAGIVRAIGPDTETPLKIGDHVFGQTNYLKESSDQCGMQEYALLDSYTVAKVPESFRDDDGASLVTNLVTPFWAIFGEHGLNLKFPFPGEDKVDYSDETIVIIGGGSNCGKYAVQSCALAGFSRIVVTADKAKNEAVLKSYGATHVVDRHGTDKEVEARIRNIVGDDLIYALDAVNLNHNLGLSILSRTKKGTLACIVPGMENKLDFEEKAAGYEEKFIQGQSHNQPELGKSFWEALPGWMEEGKIKATGWSVIDGLRAEKVNEALDVYVAGKVPEKQFHVHVRGADMVKP